MAYGAALKKAWEALAEFGEGHAYEVALLSDTYDISLKDRAVLSRFCNAPAKEFLALLILHYQIGILKNKYLPSGEWISLKEVEGGQAYYPAFRRSVIETILRKFAEKPNSLLASASRFKAKRIELGDFSVELATFPGVFLRIVLWQADEEFGPDATILFDKNLAILYSMEDIVVFCNFVAASL